MQEATPPTLELNLLPPTPPRSVRMDYPDLDTLPWKIVCDDMVERYQYLLNYERARSQPNLDSIVINRQCVTHFQRQKEMWSTRSDEPSLADRDYGPMSRRKP